jgi:hypothetical protein
MFKLFLRPETGYDLPDYHYVICRPEACWDSDQNGYCCESGLAG